MTISNLISEPISSHISLPISGGDQSFLPSKLSNLQAWYDADDSDTITTSTGVSQWNDKSGNDYHATQSTSGDQPATGTNTLNGKNVLTFDGTDDNLTLPSALCSSIPNGDSTIFVVARQDAKPQQERIITMATSSNSTRMAVRYNGSTSRPDFINNNTGSVVSGNVGFESLNYNIITTSHTGTTMTLSSNASTESTTSTGANVSDASIGSIGAVGNGNGDNLDGDIAEIIIYNRVLTESERLSVHRYLYNKWGVLIKGTLIIPTRSDVSVPFNVTYDGYTFSNDLDASDYKITPTNTYNSVTNLRTQIATGNATNAPYEINMTAGLYDRNTSWNPFNTDYPTQDFNIIGASTTFLTSDQDLTMVADTGTTYKSNAARTSVGSIYDTTVTDLNGTYERLTLAADLATCRSTAGSYFVDGSDIVYIHTSDQRDLTANSGSTESNGIRVFLSVEGPTIQNNITGYVENLRMQGNTVSTYKAGINNAEGSPDAVIAKDCEFSYSLTSNGFSSVNAPLVVVQDCVSRDCSDDGFNYHDYIGVGMVAYEVNCEAYGAGTSGNTSSNSSTAHEDIFLLRVGGTYVGGYRVIHDIDECYTVNIGCEAKDSVGSTASTDANWVAGASSTDSTTMFLIGCKSSGSASDLRVAGNSTIYVDAASRLLDGSNNEADNGRIISFKPSVIT